MVGLENIMKKLKKPKVRRVAPDPGKTRRAINKIIKERDERGSSRAK